MPKRVRVNVTTQVNSTEIRREERNGRETIVVPSTTMPDDIVMNDVFYPAEEIKNSFMSLNRTPAPLGHPEDGNGAFLSAREPEAINEYWVGAHNENVRQVKREGGGFRVHVDKVIDVETAKRTEGGRALLEAIDKGEPIHTSTGLWANIAEAGEDADYSFTASDIEFDHDAILLNEIGAAQPKDGVGMMVNKDGKTEEVEVINSMLDAAEQELEWGLETVTRALDKEAKAPIIERLKTAIREVYFAALREPTANTKEPTMDEEQFNALSDRVDTIAASVEALTNSAITEEKIGEMFAASIKPLTDQLDAANTAQQEKDEAELAELVEKIVKANLLDEEDAKELTLNTARKLAKKCEPGKAAPIASAFQSNSDDDEFKDYDPNENFKEAS